MIDEIYVPPIIPCCCAWTDLLGFSNLYTQYNWSLSALVDEYSKLGAEYIKGYIHFDRLYNLLSMTHMTVDFSYERVLTVNDGVARNVDLKGNILTPLPLLCWIRETISKHDFYCAEGIRNGFPGVRTSIAIGERTDFGLGSVTISDFLRKRVQHDEVIIHSPREFQNNLAFAKAYFIDGNVGASQKSGLGYRGFHFVATDSGSNYFIENAFISFLITLLDGKTYTVPSYYKFDDKDFSTESRTLIFAATFADGILDVSCSASGKEWCLMKLLFSKPIAIRARGLSTEVLELVEVKQLLREDYRGPIYQ